jgi:hypothetical protein
MTIATIWQAVTLLIKYLPTLIEAIQRGEEFIELKIFIKKVESAEDKAKNEDDTRDLNKLLPK